MSTTALTRSIDPLDYIVDWDPEDERVLSVSSWYTEENITVDVEQWVGRHGGSNVYLGVEVVNWFLAQGWYVVATSRLANNGHWLVYSSAGNYAGAVANYWSTVSRVALRRVRINPKIVLQDMIGEFTKAYNEGRRLNDQRYDELVRLYAAIVVRTQDDVEPFRAAADRFAPLVDQIVRSLDGVPEDYASKVDAIVANLGGGGEEAVNERFDELVAKAKADLVSRGLWNSTLYASTLAEIERQRSIALDEVRSKNAALKLDALKGAAALRAQIADAILGVVQKMTLEPVQLRNKAFGDMFAFMERRTDDYPGLDQLLQVTTSLGYGNGATLYPSTPSR